MRAGMGQAAQAAGVVPNWQMEQCRTQCLTQAIAPTRLVAERWHMCSFVGALAARQPSGCAHRAREFQSAAPEQQAHKVSHDGVGAGLQWEEVEQRSPGVTQLEDQAGHAAGDSAEVQLRMCRL